MAESGKVKVRVDSTGVDAEFDSASAKKFGELVSPFTNIGRTLGDRIAIWGELWNFEYAIAAAERAHQIAKESQIAIEAKPSKFLRNWAVSASLEDDEEMIDKWANLLLSASRNFATQDSVFISILSNLGADEARFLDQAWDRMPNKIMTLDFVEKFGGGLMNPSIKSLTGNEFTVTKEELARFADNERDWAEAPFFDDRSMIYRAAKEFLDLGLYADQLKFFDNETTFSHSGHAIEESEYFAVCSHLGIWANGTAKFRCRDEEYDNPLMLEVSLHGLTTLGVRFLSSCKGFDLSNHFDEYFNKKST